MNRDELQGKATDDPDLEAEDNIDRAAGAVQETAGTLRRKIEGAVKTA